MIEKVNVHEKTMQGSTLVFAFTNNRNVTSVELTMPENFADFKGKKVTVEYALNGVITDLIPYGEATVDDDRILVVESEKPVSASHIYVTPQEEMVSLEDVVIYEEISEETAAYYPCYFDTDLGENYILDTVSVYTTPKGFSHYSVYTSMDGRDFDFVAKKCDQNPCDFSTGDVYSLNGREARIIRVYIEYNTASVDALFDRVEFTGKKSGTPLQKRAEISIPAFADSEYNVEVTVEDTYEELYKMVARRLGAEYCDWFTFRVSAHPQGKSYDYFRLSDENGRVLVEGNNGVSLAMGLNHYLKYFCKVNISQVGDQAKMPSDKVLVGTPVFKETKARVRYSYNYCTLSYTMAFWGEKDWEYELDWLAMNGVNVVLDATAQEEVWRRFLTSIGYTHDEVKKFVAGPAYYAWAYMANLSGFGGPVHDSWFVDRTELARKNHLRMRKLGMYPVLQGYSGMVPNDITEHFSDIDIIPQGTWCSFDRPAMLRTTAPVFREFAAKFYQAQSQVYGDYSYYFATDPFHEGGNVADMSYRQISHEVLGAMMKHNKDAVWIIQSWQINPTSELLLGISDHENGRQHALILDLYAERYTNSSKGHPENPHYGYSREFDKTPWIFCMLNNFGGRLGLYGHIDSLAENIPLSYNTCEHIAGIGITPEASFNNPVLYDFLFESVWRDNADAKMEVIDLKEWVCDYAERRYGAKSASANETWQILLETVYKSELSNLGQGAPESVVNARPAFEVKTASTWGNAIISYDKKDLKRAARLLLEDYEVLKHSEGYRYDLVTIFQQILANSAQDVHQDMVAAFERKDLAAFKEQSDRFLKIADLMENVLSCSEHYMLGRWVAQANTLSQNADDFTKMLYQLNAKSLVTTWGSYNQCETGGLRDYSNRQWAGLVGDFYKKRWERWIVARINELNGQPFEDKINWFEWEWEWVRRNTEYNATPLQIDLLEISKDIVK